MTHDALVGLNIGAHAALLLGVLAAYYKFGDRTEIIDRSLQGTEATLKEIRRIISSHLADNLRRDLGPSSPASSIVVLATAESYVERPSNPFDSERFRDVIREFVEDETASLVDCRNLILSRDSWMRAVRQLGRCLLLFAAYEGIVAGVLVFLDKAVVYQFPDVVIKLTAIPTSLFFLFAVFCMLRMQRNHDQITEIRHRYAET